MDLPGNIEDPLPTFLPKVVCPNPAHDTHKAHFQINTRKPFVHCFARCGIEGSYEHAVSVIMGFYDKHGVTAATLRIAKKIDGQRGEWAAAQVKIAAAHKEARKFILKGHTRVALGKNLDFSAYAGTGTRKSYSKDDPVAQDEKALRGGRYQYLPSEVRAYLDKRGVEASSRGKWELGWCEDEERLILPAYDERHVFRFLIKRSLTKSGNFKYLYTDGAIKSSLLYGACYADREQVQSLGLVLCEGSLDVIRLHQMGVKTAVAILGSGLSKKQLRIIDRMNPRRVYLFFDKDVAGAENIANALATLRKVPIRVCRFPSHRDDPAEMTREEVERAIERALPIDQFYRKARERSKQTRREYA